MTISTLPKKETKHGYGYLWLLLSLILLALIWFGFMKLIDFNSKFEIKKQAMVIPPQFHWPLRVEERKPIIVKETFPEYNGVVDTPIKKYVCEKFGVMDCKIALGIIDAESHFNETAWNINTNGTIDVGLWQINSVHFNQPGCDIKSALDPIRATDCAFGIYKAAGNSWHDWVTFNTGAYLTSL